MTIKRKPPTWEQPRRTVLRRWRDNGGITWVYLDCGHEEPATGRDLAGALRCQQCNPVPKGTPTGDFA